MKMPQFSLRTLILATAIVAIYLGASQALILFQGEIHEMGISHFLMSHIGRP